MDVSPVTLFSLSAGKLRVDLAPERGASIVRFVMDTDAGPVMLMRPGNAAALKEREPRQLASFPLIPYSGRIAGGRVRFGRETVTLPGNWSGGPHPIHGDAWLKPWKVVSAKAGSAALVYEHDGKGWPVRYRARQTFVLDDAGLAIEIGLENIDTRPMPAGIGVHPYFPKTPATRLEARLGHVWLSDAELIPTERVAVPAAWDFAGQRALGPLVLDNCFGDWDGKAVITWPERKTKLAITAEPPLSHLVIYTPKDQDFFCVEPVSHAAGGFALAAAGTPDTGTMILGPGERLIGRMRFEPSPVDR
ncbi:MAG: aldose 1-epimerase [Proteobacteria bacterium]|nr:aldose 1-epimerase [Pseudomonadota bacterium]MBI3499494.1 aldose 1-epimerase [Pseudomonadota bacterium]